MKPQYLGEFEYSILLAILQLEDAYAVPVRPLLEERTGRPVARGARQRALPEGRTGRRVARGALYTALERLEQKGCLRSRMADPTDDRGGKPRRYFALTAAGVKGLEGTHSAVA